LETALNRASSDRVTQAAALWAMLNPRGHPAAAFEDAWRNVLLYSEHTWGAWCSISEPSRRDTREQWTIKQSYAVAADLQSRDLLSRGLAQSAGPAQTDAIDVFNTTSWPRRELVSVPKFLSEGKDRVTDAAGQPVASQRLRGGELVVLADGVPPFAARRYTLGAGQGHVEGKVTAQGAVLDNGILKVRVDEQTGGIVELRLAGLDANLADTDDGQALNEYLYFNGENPSDAKRNGPVKISVGERGPLVASLLIESDAPGCHRLVRELRLVAGQDTVEIINTLDKDRLVAASYHAKEGKESLNFGFPFAVPEGQVRLEVPFGVIRPDDDQIPSACKNWFTVGRWADVANEHYGITWVTLDAPLVQVGGLTANLLNSQSNPAAWRKKVGRTQKLYSWAMNNHWGTNYRAYQEGPHVFRFILRPHRGHDPLASSRLAIAASQPLLPVGARGAKPASASRLQLSSPDVLVTGIEPSDDGRALMVRLWGAAGREARTDLVWSQPKPKQLWLSDTSQQPMRKLKGPVTVPAWGVVTVRAELGK
jgi:alpha-mannosidase